MEADEDPPLENDEKQIENLKNQLKIEKDAKKREIDAIREEMEKEMWEMEQKWMEKVRKIGEERDNVVKKIDDFEEKIDQMRRQVQRSETYKMEIEEANMKLRGQYEALHRDYEETMQERSVVLEENARLIEEKDRINKEMQQLKNSTQAENEEIGALKKKLEHTRRLLQVNMEETVTANAQKEAALARMNEAEQKGERLTEERDEAIRKSRNGSNDTIVDIWNTHSVQINLPFQKSNLGIQLGGGRTDDDSQLVHGPIYVKWIGSGSPFENLLKKLDHIVMINDISVTDMDEKSVMGMLSNSHHIHLVIRRRSNCNRIIDVVLPLNYDVGLELSNGVFINSCEPNGTASRNGLVPGQRVVHVMHTPVYDAKHAEMLIKNAREPVTIGILQSLKRGDQVSKEKQRNTIFSKLFGRTPEKEKNVVAKANIDRNTVPTDVSALLRQGSLRMPQGTVPTVPPLVRYGSLRAPTYSSSVGHSKMYLDTVEKRINATKSDTPQWSPTTTVRDKDLVFAGTNIEGVPVYVPKNAVFSTPTSPVTRLLRQNPDQKRTMSQISSPQERRAWDGRSFSSNTTTSDARPYSIHFTPTSSTIMEVHNPRRSVCSPSYPAIRDESLSSIISSSNSIRLPSTSFSHQYTNNSACSLSNANIRHGMSKDGSDFSISTTGSAMLDRSRRVLEIGGKSGGNGGYRGGKHEELLGNHLQQPRLVEVLRSEVRLCGGNSIGILAEKSVGADFIEGDLILEIDGNSVRSTTLESAVNTLLADDDEFTRILIQDGGDRLNRLRLGADGDSFFLRVNIDRSMENKDELELKSGDIVFVDKTIYMGKRGKWRAWKVDKEGRQREHGAIPSSSSIYQSLRISRSSQQTLPHTRGKAYYEWVEKLDNKLKRPVLIFGALVQPFCQLLVDESDRFSTVTRETLTASLDEVTSLIKEKILIDSKQDGENYDTYHVISTAQIMEVTSQRLHCVLNVDALAIDRLRRCRIYPIIIKIRFKSVKQLKDISEHICGDKISSKEAKSLIEKDLKMDKYLENAVPLVVPNHNNASFMLTHAVLQLKKLIEEEQKKIVWVERKIDDNHE